jgi:hypothetical protein
MLTQIVRPMVRTQIRLLANSQATYATLVKTISQWLGFLGVQASVTQLQANSKQIQLSLTVGRPESCDEDDWQKILDNLNQSNAEHVAPALTPQQERKLQRLLAYIIQVGNPNGVNWDILSPQLQTLAFTEDTLAGIRAALKVPQSLEQLTEGLDPDIAAVVLSKAVGIALLDREVNEGEDRALSVLLETMKHGS